MKSPRMDMRSSLAHLPARKQRELERILTILHEEFGEAVKASSSPTRRAGRILKIILFGSHARDDWVEDPKGGYFSDYDLLVIVNEAELAEMSVYWYTAEDRILNARAIKTPVSFIVHSLEEVNDALGQGEYFFADIVTDGILLYELNGNTRNGTPRHTLVQPKPPTPQAAYERAKTYFEFWTDQADEESIIVAFRRHTLLPLDDCLYALQPAIPHLTRSSLHRCLQRHGISRLPDIEGDKPAKKKFKACPIGYCHIDIAEVQTGEGKLRLFVAIDRTSKFAYAELHQKAGKMVAAQFLPNLIAAVPYAIHTVLTDNGIQFTNHARHKYAFHHIFDRVCDENGIEHRLTKINHPWTNGQVERMNRTIKDATVKRFHYDDHDQLRRHLQDFINAYNFGRRLKTLKGLTPYEFI